MAPDDSAARPRSVAVVGAGIVGLATALTLRERGFDVTVYERGEPGHGQSAGHTRIFRLNHADPRLIALAIRAREIWRSWEERFGARLLGADGALVAGPAAAARMDSLVRAGAPARWLEGEAQARALPVLRPFDGRVLLDERGGPIDTDRAIDLLVTELGPALARAEVLSVRASDSECELFTPLGSAAHDACVVCAGRGTSRLAQGLGIELPLEVSLHLRATFAVPGPPPARLAALQDATGQYGETVYAAALPGRDRYAIGIGGDDGALAPGGDAGVAGGLQDLRSRLSAYVTAAMPGLDPRPVSDVCCWVTRLPWSDDGLALWRRGRAFVLAGHNLFKNAPAVAELVADSIESGRVHELLDPARELGRAARRGNLALTSAGSGPPEARRR